MLHFKHATAGSRWPMYDAVGTARRVVDDSRAVTDAYSLDAFGVEFASATGSTPNPYRFIGASGYITDPSGLQQLGARFYWPEIGRFVQQDPAGEGMNWYVYGANNPLRNIDPEGLKQRPCPARDHAKKCKARYEQDMAKCNGIAHPESWGEFGENLLVNTTIAAAGGAAGGAVVCSIAGPVGTGTGALLGAAGGGTTALVVTGLENGWTAYKYRRCVKKADKRYEKCMAEWQK